VHGDTDIATVAALIGDPARARVLRVLGDGRALPATVLAAEAGVAASTASEHLARLVEGGLLLVEARGRHRFYRLAGPRVGAALEALALIAPAEPVRSLRTGTRAAALRYARSCYDHLAGRMGVALMQALLRAGALIGAEGGYELTGQGRELLAGLGVRLPAGRRPPVRHCVDWSEQRPHLAGALGAAVLARLLELGWVERAPRGRALVVTERGSRELAERLGVDMPADRAPGPGRRWGRTGPGARQTGTSGAPSDQR
jgi:DNA-binding transcriptional ArsR family regulator